MPTQILNVMKFVGKWVKSDRKFGELPTTHNHLPIFHSGSNWQQTLLVD